MEKNECDGGDAEGEATVPVKEPVERLFEAEAGVGYAERGPNEDEVRDEENSVVEDRPLFVEVPEECKKPKPWFRDDPSGLVKEIRDYVAEHGESHTWWGHTHTRPSRDARVVYVGRFELPEKFQPAKQFLVCPLCRPASRNFGAREGYIAWFPDEEMIRLIGPDCFAKKVNKEAHEEAVKEFKNREKRKSEISFLVSQRDQHRLALKVLAATQRVARALDAFGADLRRKLYDSLNIQLWPHVRTGELRVSREVPDIQLPGKTLFLSHRFGSLDGFKLIDPEAKKLEPKFGPHIAFLGEALALSDEQWDAKVNQLDEPGRAVQVKKLGKALDDARYLRAEITDLRSFLAPDNIGTFRAWGSPETEGSPIGAYARRDGSTLRVGSSERRTMPVQIPLDLELDIPSVAGLTAKRP